MTTKHHPIPEQPHALCTASSTFQLKKTVIRCTQHQLHDAATNAVYQHYLQDKFQWTTQISSTVDWQLHALTQQQLNNVEKHVIEENSYMSGSYFKIDIMFTAPQSTTNSTTETVKHFL